MPRLTLFLLIAVALGCDGSSKKDDFAKPIDDGLPVAKAIPVSGVKPAATSPAARKLIDELINAHTGNSPSALIAFRNCTIKRTGEVNQGSAILPAECVERFAWPGRFRADWKLAANPMTIFLNGESVRMTAPMLGEKPSEVSARQARSTLEDVRATWMTLLVPLAETKDLLAETVEVPPENLAVRVWIGSQPPLVLLLDAKTKQLQKVFFEKLTDGRVENWQFVLAELKPVQGVLLPHKLTYTPGRQAGAVWTSVTYEPTSAFPDGTFER